MEASRKREFETITHREMRNNSGEVLRRAQSGEVIQVTNNGEVVAEIGPPSETVLEALRRRGKTKPATHGPGAFKDLKRIKLSRSTAEILADSRGRW